MEVVFALRFVRDIARVTLVTVAVFSGAFSDGVLEAVDFPQLRRSLVGRKNRYGYATLFSSGDHPVGVMKLDLQVWVSNNMRRAPNSHLSHSFYDVNSVYIFAVCLLLLSHWVSIFFALLMAVLSGFVVAQQTRKLIRNHERLFAWPHSRSMLQDVRS